jgi:hypothetical protein
MLDQSDYIKQWTLYLYVILALFNDCRVLTLILGFFPFLKVLILFLRGKKAK